MDRYNVRITVSLPQKEGEEDKKVIKDSQSVTVSQCRVILIDWFRHRSLWKMESFTQKEQDVCRKVTIVWDLYSLFDTNLSQESWESLSMRRSLKRKQLPLRTPEIRSMLPLVRNKEIS